MNYLSMHMFYSFIHSLKCQNWILWWRMLGFLPHSSHLSHFQTKQVSVGRHVEFAWPTWAHCENFCLHAKFQIPFKKSYQLLSVSFWCLLQYRRAGVSLLLHHVEFKSSRFICAHVFIYFLPKMLLFSNDITKCFFYIDIPFSSLINSQLMY